MPCSHFSLYMKVQDSWELHGVLLPYISSKYSCLRSVFYTDSTLSCRTWALQLMGWEDERALHMSMAWLILALYVPCITLSFHSSESLKLGSSGKTLYLSLLSFLLQWGPIELIQGLLNQSYFLQLQKNILKCQSFHVPSFTSIWKKEARTEIHLPSHGMN